MIEQPDGTLAHLPAWMTLPTAAALPVVDTPRLPIACLRELRSILDLEVTSSPSSSPSRGDELEQHHSIIPSRSVPAAGAAVRQSPTDASGADDLSPRRPVAEHVESAPTAPAEETIDEQNQ